MDVDQLRQILDGKEPVTDNEGRLRVEIIVGKQRRNKIVYVPFEEAARLLTLHGDRAAFMCFDPRAATGSVDPVAGEG